MSEYLHQVFPVTCDFPKPIGTDGSDGVLETKVLVFIEVYQRPGSNMIATDVLCKYNNGGHGDKCRLKDRENCVYSIDLPIDI